MSVNDADDDERSTFARPRFNPSIAPDMSFTVTVEEGPDAGAQVVVDGNAPSPILIGQSPVCELKLSDREVSRRHVSLEVIARGLRLSDLGSTNGTFVGELLVREAFLQGGEAIRVGASRLRVVRGAARPAPALSRATTFGRLVGASREMRRLYPLCERLAAVDVPVILEGETGTGKEVLAESLHEQGPRASGPFVIFDCTAVPPTLIESELFGHERGAFTGATTTRPGVFEEANGGTILIDEIGDLPLALQPKLLRALERSEVRRVGGSGFIRFDARVLAATRRDLDQEVQAGRFRDDLFHRLAVARIELPPLRMRSGDVAVLARRFAHAMTGDEAAIPSDVLARWEELPWPGNVRQLKNAVAQRIALGDLAPDEVGIDRGRAMSSNAPAAPAPSGAGALEDVVARDMPFSIAREKVIEAFEQQYVARVLEQHGGNVVRAAAASGLARRYFQIVRARTRR